MDLRSTLTAPKFRRKVTVQKGDVVIRVEQEVEDFLPRRTTLSGAKSGEIPNHSTLGEIQNRYLGGGPASCTLHLKEDLDVIFLNLDSPTGGFKIVDKLNHEQVVAPEVAVSLAGMQIDEVAALAQEIYLRHTEAFTDPYQHEDARAQQVTFKTGSKDQLLSQVQDLFYSFPKIFETVPEPRVFVYTEFEQNPACFNVHLNHANRNWEVEKYFLSLLKQIVRENTPCGYCYRSPSGEFERRSAFLKDALLISVVPTAPTPEQTRQARRNISAVFQKYQLTLNCELFEQNPVQCCAGGS